MKKVYIFWLIVLASSSLCTARDYTFTLKLGAGRSECFYDYIHEGAFLEIEYQVLQYGCKNLSVLSKLVQSFASCTINKA